MLKASSEREDTIYNLALVHKTLRVSSTEISRHWSKRTPVMPVGLTEHIWTIEELLTVLPLPMLNNT
jgi:hypothetical protein